MEVLHKFAQPWITHMRIFRCLLDPTKTCSFIGQIKLCRILTDLFWDAVDSFAGLFDGFYYTFTGESTSKGDKFDNLRSMKILDTPLTQKSPGIRTNRPEQEQTLQTKKGAISRPWRMILFLYMSRSICVCLQVHGPWRECLRARRFWATLLLHLHLCAFLLYLAR